MVAENRRIGAPPVKARIFARPRRHGKAGNRRSCAHALAAPMMPAQREGSAMSKASHIWTDIDYDKPGKQVGWLHLPHSVTRSAYGTLMLPIAVIANVRGPTAFFMAGNHGDQDEGQIAPAKLIRTLEPSEIHGPVIVLPAANLPAAPDCA